MLLAISMIIAASAVAKPAADMPAINPVGDNRLCPETPMSVARKLGNRPMRAIPLTELPKGKAFIAVDRRVDGCPAPMTVIEYHGPRRR